MIERKDLEDALEGMREMIGYIPEYLRLKWDLDGYIDRAMLALRRDDDDNTGGGGIREVPAELALILHHLRNQGFPARVLTWEPLVIKDAIDLEDLVQESSTGKILSR